MWMLACLMFGWLTIYSSASLFTNNGKWTIKPHLDYNYFGGDKISKDGQLWNGKSLPDFKLSSNSPAREVGIDSSNSWISQGVIHPALPDISSGCYEGKCPEAGAIQYKSK